MMFFRILFSFAFSFSFAFLFRFGIKYVLRISSHINCRDLRVPSAFILVLLVLYLILEMFRKILRKVRSILRNYFCFAKGLYEIHKNADQNLCKVQGMFIHDEAFTACETVLLRSLRVGKMITDFKLSEKAKSAVPVWKHCAFRYLV